MQELQDPALLGTASYIDGQWQTGSHHIDVINPANGSSIAQVVNAGTEQADQAIKAAKAALPEWSSQSAGERAAIMRKWFELMLENQDDLGRILTLEQGKP